MREIHAELQTIAGKLEEHTQRFDRIGKRFADTHQLVSHTLGLATMNQLKTRTLESRHDASEAWRRRMDERLDWLERRLSKVEEKLGTGGQPLSAPHNAPPTRPPRQLSL